MQKLYGWKRVANANARGITEKPMVHFAPELKTLVVSRAWYGIKTIFKKVYLILFVIQYMSRFHIIF